MKLNLTEDEKSQLQGLIKKLEERDQPIRDRQIKLWKGLELYWRHIQDIWWDESVRNYRNITDNGDVYNNGSDPYYSDKIINIMRAHGESIIAALSQEIPVTFFKPEDPDNPDDVLTAKVWTQISELINDKPETVLELIRCLYLIYNNGTIAAYIESKKDPKNGSYKVPQYGTKTIFNHSLTCPQCGGDLDSFTDENEFAVNDISDCPYCEQPVEAMDDITGEETPVITGYISEIKPRPHVEYYGMLNVRIPHFVRKQAECGYVILETETDAGYAQEVAGEEIEISGSSDNARFDRWARMTTSFSEDDIPDIVTWRRVWLRTWQLNLIGDKDIRNSLKKKAPSGLYCLLMNDTFIEACNESLDDCWVISESPLSSHIHEEPLASSIKPIQDIRNDLVLYELQSIEYSIPQTFADPQVLDFDSYSKSDSGPGMVSPAKSPAGRALADGFTTIKTASFPKDAEDFKRSLDQDGQFVTGDFPTIFGGGSQSGSKTLGEYQSSQSRALTRLSLTYKLIQVFWSRVSEKRVRHFINDLRTDEKFAVKKGQNWAAIWIRRADLTGKIGEVTPDITNGFPITWGQKHDTVLKLLEMSHNSPQILEIIGHAENAGEMAKYIGFPDLYIPGNEARNKQLTEIQELLNSEPNLESSDPITGEELPDSPSIPIDAELDQHDIEYSVGIAWLNGEAGRDAKQTNPIGYLNVRLHILQHKMVLDQQQREAQLAQENLNNKPASANNGN